MRLIVCYCNYDLTTEKDVSFGFDGKIITVTPQSTPGSILGTINIIISKKLANGSGLLRIHEYLDSVIHNNIISGDADLYPTWHNIRPTLRLTANNTFSTQDMNDYDITFNTSSFAKLQDTPSAQCTDGTTRYLILKLNLVLTSDSLYHLGDHALNIYARDQNYNYYAYTAVLLRVKAGKK